GRQVEKNRLGNGDGANGLIVQRLPSDAMKQEIGQVVINHALCDQGLYGLFAAISGLKESQSVVVTRSLKLKAGALLDLLIAFRRSNESLIYPALLSRIDSCVADYRKLSNARNVIVHWHWGLSPEGEESATATNFLSMNHGNAAGTQLFTLQALKSISLGLFHVNTLMMTIAALSAPDVPSFVKEKALESFDDTYERVKEALLGLPDLPDEELT
ncbi:hypothetical protein ABNM11_24360, partial [Pseudomonas syringae]